MKKLFLLLVIILINLASFGQVKVTDMPTYIGAADSALVPVVINNTNRKVYGIQLSGGRSTDTAYRRNDTLFYKKNGTEISLGTYLTKNAADLVYASLVGYNKTNWDAAYSWGNHAGLYSLLSHRHDTSYVRLNDSTKFIMNRLTYAQTASFNINGWGKIGQIWQEQATGASEGVANWSAWFRGRTLIGSTATGGIHGAGTYGLLTVDVNGVSTNMIPFIVSNGTSTLASISKTGVGTFAGLTVNGGGTFAAQMQLANLSTAPTVTGNGWKYYNQTTHKEQTYVNGAWKDVLMSGDLGATNGLTASGNSVELGGTILKNTAITIGNNPNAYSLDFSMFTGGGFVVNNFKLNKGHLQFQPSTNGGGWAMYIGDYDNNFNATNFNKSTYGITHRNVGSSNSTGYSTYIFGGDGAYANKSLVGFSAVIEGNNTDVTYQPELKALTVKATNTTANATPYAIYSDGGINYFKDKIIAVSLKTTSTAPATVGTTKMLVSDTLGNISFENKPTVNKGYYISTGTGGFYVTSSYKYFQCSENTFADDLAVDLSTASPSVGDDYYIINRNSNATDIYYFNGATVKKADGTTITNLTNGTTYHIVWNGTEWISI